MSAASQPAVQSASTAPSPISELPDELLVACAAFLDFPRDLLNFGESHKRANALPTDHLWREFCVRRWAAWPRYALTQAREAALDAQFPGASWRNKYRHCEADAARTMITAEEIKELHWHFNFTAPAGGRGRSTLKQARFSATSLFVPGYPPLEYHLVPLPGPEAEGGYEEEDLEDVSAEGGGSGGGGGSGAGSSSSGSSSSGGANESPRRAISAIRSLMSKLLSSSGATDDGSARVGRAPRQQIVQIANFPPHWVERLEDSREWLIYNDNVTFVSCGPDGEPGNYDERGFLTDLNPVPPPAGLEGMA